MTTQKATNSQLARLLLLVPWLAQNPGVTAKQAADEFDVTAQQHSDCLRFARWLSQRPD